MDTLFPYTYKKEFENENELPIFKEIGWDYLEDIPLVENGDYVELERDEALKVWIYKAVKTKRYKYIIYDDDYGTEIYTVVGGQYTKGYTESEVIRFIREAILINPYILSITKLNAEHEGALLKVSALINTIYSEDVEVEFNV